MQAAGQIHPRSQHNYECSCTVGAGFATGDLLAARTVRLWEPVSGETVDSRAVNEPSRSFHNHREDPYYDRAFTWLKVSTSALTFENL